jgi:predicted XRE-type DNA-binding protein
MAKRKVQVESASGNVFTDLGYGDAKERTLKVEFAVEVNRLLRSRGLTQAAAARLLGIRQPHVSDLVRYRLERFSVERLMAFLVELGQDVEIRIRSRPARGSRAAVRVLHSA